MPLPEPRPLCLKCGAILHWQRVNCLMCKKIWVYTPTGLLLTISTLGMEQKWLDKGLLVAYVPLSLPKSFEFEIVS